MDNTTTSQQTVWGFGGGHCECSSASLGREGGEGARGVRGRPPARMAAKGLAPIATPLADEKLQKKLYKVRPPPPPPGQPPGAAARGR